jgi:hypothetical protein
VSVKGSAAVKHEVRERKDGALEVAYVAPMSGEYRVTLSMGAVPIQGSPFRVPCQQPRPCERASGVQWGDGLAFAGERYAVRVTCLDQFGARCPADPKCAPPHAPPMLHEPMTVMVHSCLLRTCWSTHACMAPPGH